MIASCIRSTWDLANISRDLTTELVIWKVFVTTINHIFAECSGNWEYIKHMDNWKMFISNTSIIKILGLLICNTPIWAAKFQKINLLCISVQKFKITNKTELNSCHWNKVIERGLKDESRWGKITFPPSNWQTFYTLCFKLSKLTHCTLQLPESCDVNRWRSLTFNHKIVSCHLLVICLNGQNWTSYQPLRVQYISFGNLSYKVQNTC